MIHRPNMGTRSSAENLTTQLAPESPPVSRSGVVLTTRVVLIVDDDDEGVEVVQSFLTATGYRVLAARNGVEARQILESRPVDLVLLDVDLPDKRGTTLLREWRTERGLQDLPVLMTTALDAADEMVAAFNAGANDYVIKPFDFGVLAARIAAHLRTKSKQEWERQVQVKLSRSLILLGSFTTTELCGEALANWEREVVDALEDAFAGNAVGVWSLADGVDFVLQRGIPPTSQLGLAHRRTILRTLTPLVQQSAIWLPITNGANLMCLASIELQSTDFIDSMVRLASTFVKQLSVHLEVNDTRRKLASNAPAHVGENRGVGVCPVCNACYDLTLATHCPADEAELSQTYARVDAAVEQRYHLERLVGEGGMGAVFRAFDSKLSRRVAIKLLHEHLAERDDLRTRFVSEATLCARLRHPHLVSVYDFGELRSGGLFIVMEWVNGTDLSRHNSLQTLLGPEIVAQVLIQSAEALDYAHRSGVIHRDVKPSNILMSHESEVDVRLVDFGVARRVSSGYSRTLPGLIVGTPKYLAPEQALGGRIGPGTDIYALATVVFELLAGTQVNLRSQGLADLSEPPVDLEHPLFSRAPPAFRTLLASAWRQDLRDRPAEVMPWALEVANQIALIEPLPESPAFD